MKKYKLLTMLLVVWITALAVFTLGGQKNTYLAKRIQMSMAEEEKDDIREILEYKETLSHPLILPSQPETALVKAEPVKVASAQTKTSRGAVITKKTTTTTTTKKTTTTPKTTAPAPSASLTEKGLAVVEYAKRFLGVPYVYGGSTPSCFDCSGFTSYVYKHFGYSLPRSAAAQGTVGTEVKRANLILGDLLFFHTVSPGISHVGIYIGNGQFIHASSSSKKSVTISSLSDTYYNSRYVIAKRILK